MSTVFSLEELKKILSNLGIDITCGECMSIGFTGSGAGAVHTCNTRVDNRLDQLINRFGGSSDSRELGLESAVLLFGEEDK